MKNINSNNNFSSFAQFILNTTASTQVLGGGRRSRRRAAKAVAAAQAAELARQASELEGMAEDLIQDELLDDTTI